MNKKSFVIISILAAFVVALSACSSKPSVNDLSGTSWHLVSYGPVDQQTPAGADIPTLVQFGPDGQVSGSFGCNQFSGNYQVKGDKITFSQIISTLMACQDTQASQESAGFKVFSGTASFVLDGNTLVITDASGETALHLTRLLPE